MPANIYLPEYSDLVVGNIIFTAYDEEGETRNLTDEEMKQISSYCNKNKALEIDPDSSEYQNYMRVEVYFDSKDETENEDNMDMGD